jgi:hypothetical protein
LRFAVVSPIVLILAVGIGSAQVSPAEQTPRKDLLAAAGVVTADTKHVAVRATLSDTEVAAGARISIAVDITPKLRMHVYAPGGKYTPVTLRIAPQPLVEAHEVVYPPAVDYFFEPLNEHAQVYSDPFRLALDVTIGDRNMSARIPPRLTLKATLDYQACDDKVCYLPTSVPLQWTVKIKR